MAIMTQQQITAELQRKANLGIAPTDKNNNAQYNAIVEKNKAINPIQNNNQQTTQTPSSTQSQPSSGTKTAIPQTPYTEGTNTYRNDGTNIYKNDVIVPQANYKYIPTEIGGLRGAGTTVNTAPSNTTTAPNTVPNTAQNVAPKQSAYDWNKLTSGGYDTNKEFTSLAQSMIGADRNKYIGDQQALTLYDYMNGQKNFGTGANNYGQIQYSNNDKRYDNDISRADQTMMLLYTQLGKDGFDKFTQSINGKNGLEITQILNGMGMKGVDVNLLQQQVNNMKGVDGVVHNPMDKNKYLDWATTTSVNGEGVLSNGIGQNYSLKPDGSIGLNDMITNVNGQQMHIFNALKYGTGEDANKALYTNMLSNEKRSGNAEAIPLKARAELAPETMTPQMKADYQEQLQIEDKLSKQMFVLEQINKVMGGTPANPTQTTSSNSSGLGNASTSAEQVLGATSGVGGGVATGGLVGGSVDVSGAQTGTQSDASGFNFTTSSGKGAQTNVLEGLTPEQLKQMNAILSKMNSTDK